MSVGIVGSGPAAEAVDAALTDADREVDAVEAAALGDVEFAVVIGSVGEAVFERANERALEAGLEWLAVELGGVGAAPLVEASVAGFGPETGCYACLCERVAANRDGESDPVEPPAHAARFAGALAGRTALEHLSGGAVLGRVREVPHADRELHPVPHCECSPGRDRTLDRSHVERDLEGALARAERAVDERVGIVREVGELESFPLPYYLAHGSDTSGFSDATASRDAAGVAAGWDRAFMKALGEGLERYCAGVYRRGEFHTATVADLEGAVGPAAFVAGPDRDPEAALEWVPGEALSTGDPVALPAEFVQYPPPSREHVSPVTTGLGLGNGGIEAILAGLYEVIERDAAMLAWYSTFDPLALSVDDPGFATLADRARSEGLSVSTRLLTQDVDVPVVAAAVTRSEWPRFALGSGADLDAVAAARSALAEALQNWMELRGMGPDDAAEAGGEIGRYAECPPDSLLEADQSVPAASVGPGEVPTGEAELEAVLDRLGDAGLAAYAARTTTPDVGRLGFEAVRALVPRAQPLFFGDPVFGERARTVPSQLGFEPALERAHHPFP